MRYLITGGCGFIGSHLAEALVGAGHTVDVLDDLSTGTAENVAGLLDGPRFSLTVDTILNIPILDDLVRRADFVFHLAAVVGVKKVLEQPVESIVINVEGTQNVLKSCVRLGRKVFLASTSEIYGKNENVPFVETADSILGATRKRRWSYACAKALDEFLAFAYHDEMKLPVIVVRFFNTVGPRQSDRYGMVIPRFVRQALAGAPLTVFGDGKQSRCFTHVRDVVDAVVKLANAEGAFGNVFNVGSSEEITIGDLALLVRETAGSSSAIEFIDPRAVYPEGFEDMTRRIPDVSKARNLIGFAPTRTIRDIVRETVEYYRNRPAAGTRAT